MITLGVLWTLWCIVVDAVAVQNEDDIGAGRTILRRELAKRETRHRGNFDSDSDDNDNNNAWGGDSWFDVCTTIAAKENCTYPCSWNPPAATCAAAKEVVAKYCGDYKDQRGCSSSSFGCRWNTGQKSCAPNPPQQGLSCTAATTKDDCSGFCTWDATRGKCGTNMQFSSAQEQVPEGGYCQKPQRNCAEGFVCANMNCEKPALCNNNNTRYCPPDASSAANRCVDSCSKCGGYGVKIDSAGEQTGNSSCIYGQPNTVSAGAAPYELEDTHLVMKVKAGLQAYRTEFIFLTVITVVLGFGGIMYCKDVMRKRRKRREALLRQGQAAPKGMAAPKAAPQTASAPQAAPDAGQPPQDEAAAGD